MLKQVADGVLVHQSELLQNNAVVVQGPAGVLGSSVVIFPGGHGGFMGGEYGQEPGKPVEFAAKLREVLAG